LKDRSLWEETTDPGQTQELAVGAAVSTGTAEQL